VLRERRLELASEIVDFVSGEAVQVVEKAEAAKAKVDADDALVLGEALAGQAEIFVTGDAALLDPGSIGALLLVSPRRFWEILHSIER
jgi:predicted nucleic acid-binding protein